MIHDGLSLEKCETTELLPKNKILRPSFCDLGGIKVTQDYQTVQRRCPRNVGWFSPSATREINNDPIHCLSLYLVDCNGKSGLNWDLLPSYGTTLMQFAVLKLELCRVRCLA